MKVKTICSILIIFFFFHSYSQNNCNKHFTSYSEAQNYVEHSYFKFSDNANCNESSWIREARYYSCDLKTGYFEYKTDKKIYIHDKLPINIWYQFKNAESKGKFYNQYIKYKYRLLCETEK